MVAESSNSKYMPMLFTFVWLETFSCCEGEILTCDLLDTYVNESCVCTVYPIHMCMNAFMIDEASQAMLMHLLLITYEFNGLHAV